MRDISDITPGLINAACPVEGVAVSGQPTAEHLSALAAEGYRTVIDLRTPDEDRGLSEPEAAREAGLEYVALPLAADPADFDAGAFDRFRALMRDPGTRPALIHCRTAARVEPLLLAHLVLDEGYSLADAETAAAESGAVKEELHERALQYLHEREAL